MPMGQRQSVGRIGKLEAIASEIFLAVTLALHQLPLVRWLTRQIGQMTQMANANDQDRQMHNPRATVCSVRGIRLRAGKRHASTSSCSSSPTALAARKPH